MGDIISFMDLVSCKIEEVTVSGWEFRDQKDTISYFVLKDTAWSLIITGMAFVRANKGFDQKRLQSGTQPESGRITIFFSER